MFEDVRVGSMVVAETTVAVSVRCSNALACDSGDCVLASAVVEVDMLDVMDVVEISRELELLCKDVLLVDDDADVVTVEMDRLVKVSVACDAAVTS